MLDSDLTFPIVSPIFCDNQIVPNALSRSHCDVMYVTALRSLAYVKTTQRSYIKTVPSAVTEAMNRPEEKIACAADVVAGFGGLIFKLFGRMEPTSGLEPLTCRLRIGCSTN